MKITSKFTLNNGVQMPALGLGVFLAEEGIETRNAVKYAFEAGYRHIDTAKLYYNEVDVGFAVNNSGIPRNEIFVTTKLWTDDFGYSKALKAFESSIHKLNMEYIDLYLLHWPGEKILRQVTWKALEKIYADGKCKAIGVSNFTIRHLDELLSYAKVIPAVNQVEFSPFLYQKKLLDYCIEKNIKIVAYSPLARGKKFSNKVIQEISAKYSRTPAQIFLRWALQLGLSIIPKSTTKERIIENADIFDFIIENADMIKLNSLNENFRASADPELIP